jgi:hypothetical protein
MSLAGNRPQPYRAGNRPQPYPAGYRPQPPARPEHGGPVSGRRATGRLLALAVVLVLGLPLLPVILLLVLGIRLRDRLQGGRAGRDRGGRMGAPTHPNALRIIS